MVLIKLGKQQTGVWGEWAEMQIAIPVQVLGLVCERKLHKQSFEGLGLGQFVVASFSFSLCPCCYLSLSGCAKSSPLESHIQPLTGVCECEIPVTVWVFRSC